MAGSGCAWGAEPPRFLEAFGRLWQVQSRLGSGSSASVYRVRCCGTPGSPPGALKQFLPPGTTGAAASAAEYGFRKERAALEQLQGHRNIVSVSSRQDIHILLICVLCGKVKDSHDVSDHEVPSASSTGGKEDQTESSANATSERLSKAAVPATRSFCGQRGVP
ncbi:serine/threonine-protein kinase Kist-like isoform X1 [Arvicanthis niloticus]|uniref:serine/threonine-protein kinase Kist-like isoform X1 n=1 Tax=Arvicanthis niloticus TaxID=61156 RepID=UPI00402BAC90